MDQDEKRSSSMLSLPNLLSASRIAAAPLLALLVLTAKAPALAAWLVLLAALTDVIDGIAARQFGRVSDFGAVLDPIADKIFILTALSLLWGDGVITGSNAWAALIILWREILISGLRDYARRHGLRASVSKVAKLKTAAQFGAAIILFASRVPSWTSDLLLETGFGLLWTAACLALYTGVDYFWHAWRRSWK